MIENWRALEGLAKQIIRKPGVRVWRAASQSLTAGVSFTIEWDRAGFDTGVPDLRRMPDWGCWSLDDPTKIYFPYTGYWLYGTSVGHTLTAGAATGSHTLLARPNDTAHRGVDIRKDRDSPFIQWSSAGLAGGFFQGGDYYTVTTSSPVAGNLTLRSGLPHAWAVCVSRDMDW